MPSDDNSDPQGRIFYPTLTQIMNYFFAHYCFYLFIDLLINLFIYLFENKVPEVPENAKMQFHMMTLFVVLGKITLVRYDFLPQGKISDILIRCARNSVLLSLKCLSRLSAVILKDGRPLCCSF